MKKFFLLLLSTTFFCCTYAQTASVKGYIRDTSSKENLNNTTIALLRAKDSILMKVYKK
jgi:hypothetical protein